MTYANRPRALPVIAPIARQQLWFFVASIQRLWPFVIMPLVILGTLSRVTHPDMRSFASLLLAVFVAAVAWPQQKTAGGIGYFRSLPPAHWKNASVRTAAMWLVLMVLCLAAFLAVDSGYRGPFVFWISAPALVAATFALLVLSGLFAATRYGILWLIGGHVMLNLAEGMAGSGAVKLFEPLIAGRLGPFAAMTGHVAGPISETVYTGHVVDPKTWLLASALWLAVGLAIFLFATTRRREY